MKSRSLSSEASDRVTASSTSSLPTCALTSSLIFASISALKSACAMIGLATSDSVGGGCSGREIVLSTSDSVGEDCPLTSNRCAEGRAFPSIVEASNFGLKGSFSLFPTTTAQ
ncbi:hypothetical protein K458DRAFT_465853 [Lentithecium fluviatile CBS 122367]|uniref:Uncharacterized protein n=1 Tax=Lentithecium fluviatile CBS 122367 TaxID=1168545 RepID=A0A6G1IHP8_9PLEO|nr:hypothetical protein K458DRAFT_465853 [Lentithecium fluviatile CBS 122367]